VTPLGIIHLATAIVALLVGAAVLWLEPGTQRHTKLGKLYAAAMLALNVTALLIYRLTGAFNVLHVLALVSLITLFVGLGMVWSRRHAPPAQWVIGHYRAMGWSYIGLVAAAVAETAVRVPPIRALISGWGSFGVVVGVAAFVVCAIGGGVLSRNERRLTERFIPRANA